MWGGGPCVDWGRESHDRSFYTHTLSLYLSLSLSLAFTLSPSLLPPTLSSPPTPHTFSPFYLYLSQVCLCLIVYVCVISQICLPFRVSTTCTTPPLINAFSSDLSLLHAHLHARSSARARALSLSLPHSACVWVGGCQRWQ